MQLRRARAAMVSAGAILAAGAIAAAAGPDTKAAATIASAGCSDGNLGPDLWVDLGVDLGVPNKNKCRGGLAGVRMRLERPYLAFDCGVWQTTA